MNYSEILTSAWNAVWKHKVLFAFGLISMLVTSLTAVPFSLLGFFLDPYAPTREVNTVLLVLIGLTAVMLLVSLLISALGAAGVLKGARLADEGATHLSLADLWFAAWPYVGRILTLTLTLGLGWALLVMVPTVLGVLTAGVAFFCLMPLIFLLIPLSLFLYLYLSLILAAIVADDLGLLAALRRAWEVLRGRFWPLVLLMLILYIVQFAVGMIAAVPLYAVQLLILLPLAGGAGAIQPEVFLRTFGIVMILLAIFMSLVQSLGLTYVLSAWMIAYRRLTRPAAAA